MVKKIALIRSDGCICQLTQKKSESKETTLTFEVIDFLKNCYMYYSQNLGDLTSSLDTGHCYEQTVVQAR